MDSGSGSGGIFKLRELISEHEPALTYDFRTRFGLALSDIGYAVSLREAINLVSVLQVDPTSWLQASIHGWKHPVSFEWMLLAQLTDITLAVNSKGKPTPMPRPWPSKDMTRIGGDATIPQSEIRKILDDMRPKENDG